jgi:hypothetical protein
MHDRTVAVFTAAPFNRGPDIPANERDVWEGGFDSQQSVLHTVRFDNGWIWFKEFANDTANDCNLIKILTFVKGKMPDKYPENENWETHIPLKNK